MPDNRRNEEEQVQEQPKAFRDYATRSRVKDLPFIKRLPINAAIFEAKPITLTMLYNYKF